MHLYFRARERELAIEIARSWMSSTLWMVILANNAHAAGMTDIISTSTQANEEHSSSISHRVGLLEAIVPGPKPYSISAMTMFMGPAMNNLDGHIPAVPPSVPGQLRGSRHSAISEGPGAPKPATSPGSSMRYVLQGNYQVSERVKVGPVFEMGEKFYGSNPGTMSMQDPQLRATVADVMSGEFGANHFKSNMWLSTFLPVSKMSRSSHTLTGLGVSLVPRLQIAHSEFSLSGIASARFSLIDRQDKPGTLYPSRYFAGVQENYRCSESVTAYVMDFFTASGGPTTDFSDSDLAAEAAARTASSGGNKPHFGVMPGLMIRASRSMSVSPRLSWAINQPISTTTVGVSLSVLLI